MTPRTVPPPPNYPPDTATPPPEDDWWDRLYADDAPAAPEPEGREPAGEPDEAPEDDDVEPKKTPWWARKRDAAAGPQDPEPEKPSAEEGEKGEEDEDPPGKPPAAPQRRPGRTKGGKTPTGGPGADKAAAGPRIRRDRVLYVAANAAAAGAGWWLGLGPWLDDCLTYYLPRPGGGWITLAVLTVGIVAVDARTHGLRGRHRHPLVAVLGWAGRIPLATAVLAIALNNTN